MAKYNTPFYKLSLHFGEMRHFRTKKVFEEGDIKEGEGYVGVVHLIDVGWKDFYIDWCWVDIWLATHKETNPESKRTGFTDHRVMMQELMLWEKFESFKSRAFDKDGNRYPWFDVTEEEELFYGFTRKNNLWSDTSCTLNSWLEPLTGKETAAVVRNAGIRGSDQSKADLINIMPRALWALILPELEKITADDAMPWTLDWAKKAPKAREGELNRMRLLVSSRASGSKLYKLNLWFTKIGGGGVQSVKSLVTILQEKRSKDQKPYCIDLQRLTLAGNRLTNEHIGILSPVISICSKLEILNLSHNEKIGIEGWKTIFLSVSSNLKELTLERNEIRNAWCKALSEYLPSTLELLKLGGNIIGDNGAIALSKHLPKGLKHLNLAVNYIGFEGVNELLSYMELPNNALEHIDFFDNKGLSHKNRVIRALNRKRAAKKRLAARAAKIEVLKMNISNDLVSFDLLDGAVCPDMTFMDSMLQNESEIICSSCCRLQ